MRLRPLFFALVLALVGVGTASAQVVISAQVGRPYSYYGRGYYPPVAPVVVAPPVYYAPAPVYYAPRPVYYAPAPVYYAPRPVYYAPRPYYGRGWGRRW
ncbi:hypothetical protein GKZ68_01630 [Hymenobacter sp. BRD128]|uniref:hypothetical protein n=1 Tax=Hymenobacter sp. BRD128 TaxID=2675878 RepID=UPI0015657709|nr:hypothetical protein [Hymenobacter sp. BRD128]QKG55158.1 hypothetical protein GKZ68_01630 [Hymenobacter sp. BRD128]